VGFGGFAKWCGRRRWRGGGPNHMLRAGIVYKVVVYKVVDRVPHLAAEKLIGRRPRRVAPNQLPLLVKLRQRDRLTVVGRSLQVRNDRRRPSGQVKVKRATRIDPLVDVQCLGFGISRVQIPRRTA
jgi:hypothetical protein